MNQVSRYLIVYSPPPSYPVSEGGGGRSDFFWKFIEVTKIVVQWLVVVQWGKLVEAGQFFLNELQN